MVFFKELKRKFVHIVFTSFSAFLLNYNFDLAVKFQVCCLVIMIIYESIRHKNYFVFFFNSILRDHELSGSQTGATNMVVSCLFCMLMFDKNLAFLGILVSGWADAAASLAGRLIKSNKKSNLGSITFVLVSIFINILLNDQAKWNLIIIVSILTALVEKYCQLLGLDDNLAVSISFCCIYLFFVYCVFI